MLSDINPPIKDGKECPPLFAQRFIIDHDSAVESRLNDASVKKKPNKDVLEILDRMLRANHPFAKAYQKAHEVYNAKKAECEQNDTTMPHFRFVLLERRKAIEAGAKEAPSIHPHRLQLPSNDGKEQIGEIYFDELGMGEPRGPEPGIILTGKSGRTMEMKIWDPNIDPAMFPLLFPRGQPGMF